MNEIITLNEVMNKGNQIHLYFNGFIGLYAAYGYSAYLLSKVTEGNGSFSDDMQMPVVVINPAHVDEVKEQLNVVKESRGYFCLESKEKVDEAEYAEWVKNIRSNKA